MRFTNEKRKTRGLRDLPCMYFYEGDRDMGKKKNSTSLKKKKKDRVGIRFQLLFCDQITNHNARNTLREGNTAIPAALVKEPREPHRESRLADAEGTREREKGR